MAGNVVTLPFNLKLKDITKDWIIRHSVSVEAGYVFNKDDRGGETNHGIIKATAEEWKPQLVAKFGWNGKMIDLTEEMALYIYDEGWWKKMRCDDLHRIHPLLCQRMFDFGINGGRPTAVRYLQRLLNVLNRAGADYADQTPDGGMGKLTIGQLEAFVAKRGQRGLLYLLNGLTGMHTYHYIEISEKRIQNETFTNGWLDRLFGATEFYARVLIQGEGK